MGRLILAGWIAVALVLVGGCAGFLLYTRLVVGLSLTGQEGLLRLPPTALVRATATNQLTVKLKGLIAADVPFKQVLAIPLHDTYQADVALDTLVPLRFVIHYQGQVPIHAYADVKGTSDLVTGHHWFLPSQPLKVRVPLDFQMPVNLTVPVDTKMRFVYHGPMSVAIDQTVTTPVDTVLHTRLKVDRDVTAPILASFGLRLYPPQTPLPVVVSADLGLPLRGLRLQRADASAHTAVAP